MSLPAVRMAVGLGLLTWPGQGAPLLGARSDPRSRLVMRLLGARHVVQAGIAASNRSPRAARRGAAIDAVHACTAAALGVLDRRQRRPALTDGCVAAAFAVAGGRRSLRLARSRG